MNLLCLRCAGPFRPAHDLADYCRPCDVAIKKAEYHRAYSKMAYQRIKNDPEKRAEYNAYMRETMRHRRALARERKETA